MLSCSRSVLSHCSLIVLPLFSHLCTCSPIVHPLFFSPSSSPRLVVPDCSSSPVIPPLFYREHSQTLCKRSAKKIKSRPVLTKRKNSYNLVDAKIFLPPNLHSSGSAEKRNQKNGFTATRIYSYS